MDSAKVDDHVRIANPKHKHYNARGRVTKVDRGNVWVSLFGCAGEVCTRAKSLDQKPSHPAKAPWK